jgi:sec-independent protein translocase protein TatC
MFGSGELLLIAIVAIIVVDPKKLPDLMKGLGKAINEFKTMSSEVKRTIERESEVADFEKRKAEAEERLFGDKTADAAGQSPEAPAQTGEPAQPAEESSGEPVHEPQPEEIANAEQPAEPPVPAAEAPTEPAPIQPEAAQPEGIQPEAVQPETVPSEVGPSEASQPEAVQPEAGASAGAEETPVPSESVPAEPAHSEPRPEPHAEPHAGNEPLVFVAGPPPAEPETAAAPAPPPPPPPPAGDEAVGEGQSGRMSLFGHLQDLRKRLTRSAVAVLVGFLACYAFAGQMLKILMKPMLDVLKQSHFIYTVPTEAFFTEMKVAFVAGIFASSPYIFYQIWQFVAPGLYSHEKRWIMPIAVASALFFTVGALFGYFVVFPFGFEFFASYTSDILIFTPKLDEYLDFVLKLLFAFGIVFELPLFLFFLARLGLVTHVGLRKKRKYAVLAAFVLAAALTPPDAVSQTMMAVPLCILYEVGIWVAFFFGKKPKPAPEAEAEGAKPA